MHNSFAKGKGHHFLKSPLFKKHGGGEGGGGAGGAPIQTLVSNYFTSNSPHSFTARNLHHFI